jgi:hypothetical protein
MDVGLVLYLATVRAIQALKNGDDAEALALLTEAFEETYPKFRERAEALK